MNGQIKIKPLDPRAGLWLLLVANIGMFCEKNTEQGSMLSGIFLLLLLLYGQYRRLRNAKHRINTVFFVVKIKYLLKVYGKIELTRN